MSPSADDVNGLIAKAKGLMEQRDLAGAFQAFQEVLAADPRNMTALMLMGKMLVENGQANEAVAVFRVAARVTPDEVEPRSYLVQLLHNIGEMGEALEHVDFLIENDPTTSHWYSIPAYGYHALGDLEKTLHYIEAGTRNAARGIDWQSPRRLEMTPDASPLFECWAETTAARLLQRLAPEGPAVVCWAAEPTADGTALLRGAGHGLKAGIAVAFEILSKGGKGKPKAVKAVASDDAEAAARGVRVWSATAKGLKPGNAYECRLAAGNGKSRIESDTTVFAVPLEAPPTAETVGAETIGTGGATLYGRAGGTTLPTRYRFQWGTEAGALVNETPEHVLPPGRTTRVQERPLRWIGRYQVYALETILVRYEGEGAKDEYGNPLAGMRLVAPFAKDRNHLTGVGVAELMFGWDPTVEAEDDAKRPYAGDSLDLRDAEVAVTLSTPGLDAKDFLLAFWIQSYTGEAWNETTEKSVPWALSGQMVDPRELSPSECTLRFTLSANPDTWTYAGNNPAEQPHAARYTYHPLHNALAEHRGNLVMILLYGAERVLPEGALDIHAAELRCRNASRLAPGSGARLLSFPTGSLSDPDGLTGGWVGNPHHYWFSGPDPKAPQEFVWALAPGTTVETIRLRQSDFSPVKDIAVLVADDADGPFEPVWETELRAPAVTDRKPVVAFAKLEAPRQAGALMLRILSGHGNDRWALDAIEVFDAGPDPSPETEPCSVVEDIGGLQPGATIHYRLVAENAAGSAEGDVRTVTVPETGLPIILGAEVFRQTPERTTLLVRMCAMGSAATIWAEGEDDAGDGLDCKPVDAGDEPTPRHIALAVATRPGRKCSLILRARNQAGKCAPFAVDWETPS